MLIRPTANGIDMAMIDAHTGVRKK